MKKLIVLGFSLIAFQQSAIALACSPPPPMIAQQNALSTVLASEAFSQEMNTQIRTDIFVRIVKIDFSRGVAVELSNGCTVHGFLEYLPPASNGMCPQFKGVRLETVCAQ